MRAAFQSLSLSTPLITHSSSIFRWRKYPTASFLQSYTLMGSAGFQSLIFLTNDATVAMVLLRFGHGYFHSSFIEP
jgi:hypothetical protein